MKSSRIVLYYGLHKGNPLLLSGVNYNEDGSVKSGYVENGDWDLQITDKEFLASDGAHLRNRWPDTGYDVVEIPKDVRGGL